jgi:hypothetical protein
MPAAGTALVNDANTIVQDAAQGASATTLQNAESKLASDAESLIRNEARIERGAM